MINYEELEKQLTRVNEECYSFFEEILNDYYKYIVVLDTKTLNLLNLYKEILLNQGKIKEAEVPIILTKNAWYAKAKEYADELRQYKEIRIPTLIIEEDISFGDEVKALLETMNEKVQKNISDAEATQLGPTVRFMYNSPLLIVKSIYMSRHEGKTIPPSYLSTYQRLKYKVKYADKPYNMFYGAVTRLLTLGRDGIVSQISNSTTFSIDKKDVEVLDKNFISIKNPHFHDSIWVKEINGSMGTIGFETLYGVEAKNDRITMTPFTFFSEITMDKNKMISAFSQFYYGLKEKVEQELQDENKKDLLVDLLCFLFNQNLMLLLKEKVELHDIDYTFLRAQYEPISFMKQIEEKNQPWMSFENMEKMIREIVSSNLCERENITVNNGNINSSVLEKIEDKMYLQICKTELMRAKVYKNEHWECPRPDPLKEEFLENKENILEVLYVLLRYMNLGVLETNIRKKENDKYVTSYIWPSESILLKPIRYGKYLQVLEFIANDWYGFGDKYIAERINRGLKKFFDSPDEKEILEKLQEYVREVHTMGHSLRELNNPEMMFFDLENQQDTMQGDIILMRRYIDRCHEW